MVIHLALSAIHAGHASSTPATSSTRKDLTALSLAVAKSKRVVVVTGAGISCSSGIPDFRSSDGLYALVKSRYPNVVLKGKDLFSAGLFRESESTQLFYTFIAELKRMIDKAQPGPTHKFLKTLDAKGRLLRSYTQNIDGFEERAGLRGHVAGNGKTKKFNAKDTKNVQLHGDIHGVRCVICSANLACSPSYLEAFLTGSPPDCPECLSRSDARLARNARPLAVGNLRPSIVLYDEPHPLGEEIGEICSSDLTKKPDLLVIMGTSLKVHGIKRLVKDFANAVHGLPTKEEDSNTKTQSQPASKPQPPSTHLLTNKKPRLVVFVNRTPPPADLAHIFDYWVEGETDAWVQKVEADWRHARPQDWEVQTTLYGDTDVKGKPLAEAKNTFQTIKAGVNSKTKSHLMQSPGSENALPGRATLANFQQQQLPRAQVVLPPLHASQPKPRPNASGMPPPPTLSKHSLFSASPSRPIVHRQSLCELNRLGTDSDRATAREFRRVKSVGVRAAPESDTEMPGRSGPLNPGQRSPKKKKLSDGTARFVGLADGSESEFGQPMLSLARGPLFPAVTYSTKGMGDMSLDMIDMPLSQETVRNTGFDFGSDDEDDFFSPPAGPLMTSTPNRPQAGVKGKGRAISNIAPIQPSRPPRGVDDMSLDVIPPGDLPDAPVPLVPSDTESDLSDPPSPSQLLLSLRSNQFPAAPTVSTRSRSKPTLPVKAPSLNAKPLLSIATDAGGFSLLSPVPTTAVVDAGPIKAPPARRPTRKTSVGNAATSKAKLVSNAGVSKTKTKGRAVKKSASTAM